MCGITGIFEYSGRRAIDRDRLRQMNATLTHRGPDDEGLFVDGRVGLAMRRLSIVDVSGGHQPITNESGDIVIVFNGEIYNFQSLRNSLELAGHRFATTSDTEVIVHLYEEHGADCARLLDGMFAFAVYDARISKEPKVLLARDRLGKKPLYYADVDGAVLFGSEVKPLLRDGRVGRELDIEALHHYLSLMVIPEPFSIFAQIRKLPAGCLLECDRAGVRIRRYFDYGELTRRGGRQPPTRSEVRDLLFRAVEKRLATEVPFGAFLSGGVDSGVVVGVMSRLLGSPVSTYSIGFEGPSTHNELEGARATARHFGTNHHEIMVRPDVIGLLQEAVYFADEPFAVSSALPLLLLSREARGTLKVVLTGDGGDEVFAGYSQYSFERWAAVWRKFPKAADRTMVMAVRALPGACRVGRRLDRVARFVANSRRPVGERRLGWSAGFSEAEKRRLLRPEVAPPDLRSTASWIEQYVCEAYSAGPEAAANLLDIRVWLPDEMLCKVDRMTMAASVEARSPLLDDDLVARMANVPFEYKLPRLWGGQGKARLREAVSDLLPPHLLAGRKWGFNVPLETWFRGALKGYLASVLSPERLRKRGLFAVDEVHELIQAHEAGEANVATRLYALLVFETWAEAMLG